MHGDRAQPHHEAELEGECEERREGVLILVNVALQLWKHLWRAVLYTLRTIPVPWPGIQWLACPACGPVYSPHSHLLVRCCVGLLHDACSVTGIEPGQPSSRGIAIGASNAVQQSA